jgi:hypothetical protein
MKRPFQVHATDEVMDMMLILVLAACLLAGCAPNAGATHPLQESDHHLYYQQSVILPHGLEPNATPYGTPANAGTAGEYDRPLRPDAVSRYPGWE